MHTPTTSGTPTFEAADCTISMGLVKQVPVIQDTMSFDSRQAMRLKEMERRMMEEIRRKEHEWEKNVEQMREEFLNLYPSDRQMEESCSDPATEDNRVMERFGSTEVLDVRKMKTMFFEYPSIREQTPLDLATSTEDVNGSTAADSSAFSGKRYQLRFNVSDFEPQTVRVTTDEMRIVVYAVRLEEDEYGITTEREYCRKIHKPREIDHSKLKAYITADGILLIEAVLKKNSADVSHGRLSHSASRSSHGSHTSRSSQGSKSPASSSPSTPSKEKIGVPVFRDENGTRRMHLTVDLGSVFEPEDITIQVIKENRIQVRAKHRVKTSDRLSKSKFNKEYELGEKIETLTLRGGLTCEGKLIVGAVAKGHAATAIAAVEGQT